MSIQEQVLVKCNEIIEIVNQREDKFEQNLDLMTAAVLLASRAGFDLEKLLPTTAEDSCITNPEES